MHLTPGTELRSFHSTSINFGGKLIVKITVNRPENELKRSRAKTPSLHETLTPGMRSVSEQFANVSQQSCTRDRNFCKTFANVSILNAAFRPKFYSAAILYLTCHILWKGIVKVEIVTVLYLLQNYNIIYTNAHVMKFNILLIWKFSSYVLNFGSDVW